MQNKEWGSKATLDLTKVTAFVDWYDSALDHLAPADRPDGRRLLKWAETEEKPIGLEGEGVGARKVGLRGGEQGVEYVSDVIMAALRHIVHHYLLQRARAAKRGLEFWRKLRL